MTNEKTIKSFKDFRETQQFKTIDVFSVLSHFLSATLVIGLIVNGAFHQGKVSKVAIQAEGLAYQLISIHSSTLHEEKIPNVQKSRGLASVEEDSNQIKTIGKDPWDNTFLYRIQKGNPAKIYVWSKGPNGNNDSDLKSSQFAGDDIGYVLSVNGDVATNMENRPKHGSL